MNIDKIKEKAGYFMLKKLAIVVPCYNEEEVLETTTKRLLGFLNDQIGQGKIHQDSFILYIDDGSKDTTWELIEKYNRLYKTKNFKGSFIKGVKLAGNVGHQNALYSGLMKAVEDADFTISIDADLQDDVSSMEEMIDKYYLGADIVYGVRDKRDTDTFLKKNTALLFYKIMKFLGSNSINNHADFRLMSKRAVLQLGEYEERNLYLRGLIPMIGYKTDCVYYDRKERTAGISKYTPSKMIELALNGITSFSTKPMRLITELGISITGISILAAIYTLWSYIFGTAIAGWSSMMLSLWFLGGLILFALGIIGEYIGKIYLEVKKRPRYNIEKHIK